MFASAFATWPRAYRLWLFSIILLTAAFCVPLYLLLRLALGEEIYSHIPLMPIITGYLIWINRATLPTPGGFFPRAAALPFALGLLLLGFHLALGRTANMPTPDRLALIMGAYVLWCIALCGLILGPKWVRATAMPLALLVFMVPLPTTFIHTLETGLQQGSATAAYAMFNLSTTPVLRDDLVFHLPGITLQIAPECSGIRSTLALFITSLVAGYMFLRSPWRRACLAIVVVPLALLRNGFRVFTIGELCVRVDPSMIDSPLHHQGGPIFFALSLVPFSGILYLLVRSERRRRETAGGISTEPPPAPVAATHPT